MSVLADWLIQRDIVIEPFAEAALRPGVISYGVSSYGYDVRVGRRYKVFTNVHSAIVDPKHFNPASFVDIEGDSCIIPPNSFALAETVEYLEIPRNVLGVCLGKSTYARCFRGDTRVALVDGRAPTLEEMARAAETGERFRGYSIGPDGRRMVTLLEAPRFVGRDTLKEIVLDTGEPIRCTPDHLFLMRDGRMLEADRLRPGDSLRPLDRHRGCAMASQPPNGRPYPTHRLADAWKFRGTGPRNHKVAAVRPVCGTHDVYCLTVPEAGNFALEAGVFVRNCGIIVNVTPLEPEWRGKVTIEISNTTPLPAKIYSGEGIAQILFLKADEICRISYGDKKGKYQDQQGLTLPFVLGDHPPP